MKIDMHYFGTYAMARAAGVEPNSAKIIATASQYVDEAVESITVELEDGSNIVTFPTGHHMGSIKNRKDDDQRQVWAPFHFLPGGVGNTFSEKMLCQKDSKIARQMVAHHLSYANAPFGLEMIGVTAHVYADTFSHYGFSGFSSRQNRVKTESIEVEIEDPEFKKGVLDSLASFFCKDEAAFPNFRRRFLGDTAEKLSGALGHGAVATYPDLPYLWWCFDYEDNKETSGRKNPETFLEGCKALHAMFTDFLDRAPHFKDDRGGVVFESIEETINGILTTEKNTDGRIEAWKLAMRQGRITQIQNDEIPDHQEGNWTIELKSFDRGKNSEEVRRRSSYRFFQATNLHRTYVLRELLPAHGLMVI